MNHNDLIEQLDSLKSAFMEAAVPVRAQAAVAGKQAKAEISSPPGWRGWLMMLRSEQPALAEAQTLAGNARNMAVYARKVDSIIQAIHEAAAAGNAGDAISKIHRRHDATTQMISLQQELARTAQHSKGSTTVTAYTDLASRVQQIRDANKELIM